MPIGKVFDAREGQVLFSPVSNYYQGKALRADISLREKQAEALQMEMDSAPAAAEAAQREEQRKIEKHDADMAKADRDVEEAERTLGKERTADLAEASASLFMAYEDQASPEEATDRFFAPLYASPNFTPEQVDQMRATLDADKDGVISKKEAGAYKNFGMAYALRQKQEEQRGGEELTRLQDRLADPDLRPEDRAAIEARIAKLTAVTGTTEFDPSQSGRTDAQYGGDVKDFLDNVVGASSAVMTGTELLDIAFTNPESIGVPGKFMTWGGNLVEGSKSLMDWAGMEFKPGTDIAAETELQKVGSAAFTYDTWDTGKLGISGAEATKFQAGVYGIAFAAAVAEQGTRPTDKDIQQFIDQIGGRSSNPKAFRDTIFQFMRRQDQRLNIIADTKGIKGVDRERAFATWTPRYRDFVLKYATTSGLTAGRDPDTGEVQIIYANGKKETH